MSAFKTQLETEALGSVLRGMVEVTIASTGDKWRGDLREAMGELHRQMRDSIAHKRLVQGMDKADTDSEEAANA